MADRPDHKQENRRAALHAAALFAQNTATGTTRLVEIADRFAYWLDTGSDKGGSDGTAQFRPGAGGR